MKRLIVRLQNVFVPKGYIRNASGEIGWSWGQALILFNMTENWLDNKVKQETC